MKPARPSVAFTRRVHAEGPVIDGLDLAFCGGCVGKHEESGLVELERRRCSITYVRTSDGYEVDFLARYDDGAVELIQVCADASDPATANRELRALVSAGSALPAAAKRLLTLDRRGLLAGVDRPDYRLFHFS